jgi:hypothetical protein
MSNSAIGKAIYRNYFTTSRTERKRASPDPATCDNYPKPTGIDPKALAGDCFGGAKIPRPEIAIKD